MLIFIGVGILASFYLSCMSYAVIALAIHEKPVTVDSLLRATNHFFLRLISVRILLSLIVLAPVSLATLMVVMLFVVNTILGALSVLPFILLMLAYLIYVSIRLFFTVPSMFIDNEGPIKSIEHSYRLTRGHILQVVLIGAILYGITLLVNSSIQQPLRSTYAGLLFSGSVLSAGFYLVLVLLFVSLEAAVLAFENIFTFYAYIDFKDFEKAMTPAVPDEKPH